MFAAGAFIKATTTTGGTGALTLTDDSEYANFDDVLTAHYGAGTWQVAYHIIEPASQKFEYGVGSFVTSTKVLTRSFVQGTFSAGTSDVTAPSAISFGTSGVTVQLSIANGNFGVGVIPGTGNVAGSIGASTSFGPGLFSTSRGGSGNVLTVTVDREYYQPILWLGSCQIDQICVRLGGATNGNVKVSWYECNTNGLPGARLKDFGAFAVGSGGANSAAAVSGFCPSPGWHWLGSIWSAASQPVKLVPLISTPAGVDSSGYQVAGYYRTGSYATGLPDPAGTSSATAVGTGSGPAGEVDLPLWNFRMAN